MDEIEQIEEVKFCGRRNYNRVYIPNILRIDKTKLDHYTFVKTINAGSSFGHILSAGNYHYMCLSQRDDISVEERTMEPVGFRRSSLDELYQLADVFNNALKRETQRPSKRKSKKYVHLVMPPEIDYSKNWSERMKNYYLINIKTKEEVCMSMCKTDLVNHTNLTVHLLDCLLRDGIEIRNWCFKGERLDGQTWEEYFLGANLQCQQTPEHHFQQ